MWDNTSLECLGLSDSMSWPRIWNWGSPKRGQSSRMRPATVCLWCMVCVAALGARPAFAAIQSNEGRTVTLQAGERYGAGALHRLFFGSDYRDLWTEPIEVEELDLRAHAGGLTPLSSGGARQTRSLWLLGADGRRYSFRSIDKYPAAVLPPELRSSVAARR